jgi:hypothetical protein
LQVDVGTPVDPWDDDAIWSAPSPTGSPETITISSAVRSSSGRCSSCAVRPAVPGRRLRPHRHPAGALPAPDGEAVAYFTDTSPGERLATIPFRDVTTGQLGKPLTTGRDNWGAAWRPPGAEQFATTDGDGFVRVWNWRRGELVAERQVADGHVAGIAYRADGQQILIGEPSAQ